MTRYGWNLFRAARNHLGMGRGEVASWLNLNEPTYEAIEMGLVPLCEWTSLALELAMIRLIDGRKVRDRPDARSAGNLSPHAYA
ncbi:hypothetical protein MyNCGM683_06640 [Achromobacter xylosoxidans]